MAKTTSKKKSVQLSAAPKAKQKALLTEINKLLKKHAFSGTVAELQIKGIAAAGDCPAGQVWKEVCVKLPTGKIVCKGQCVKA